jgi:hypothetical protein
MRAENIRSGRSRHHVVGLVQLVTSGAVVKNWRHKDAANKEQR